MSDRALQQRSRMRRTAHHRDNLRAFSRASAGRASGRRCPRSSRRPVCRRSHLRRWEGEAPCRDIRRCCVGAAMRSNGSRVGPSGGSSWARTARRYAVAACTRWSKVLILASRVIQHRVRPDGITRREELCGLQVNPRLCKERISLVAAGAHTLELARREHRVDGPPSLLPTVHAAAGSARSSETSGRDLTSIRNGSTESAQTSGRTRRMLTGRPSRTSAPRASSSSTSRSAEPTTNTSTSPGIGPTSPRYRAAHDPKMYANSTPGTSCSASDRIGNARTSPRAGRSAVASIPNRSPTARVEGCRRGGPGATPRPPGGRSPAARPDGTTDARRGLADGVLVVRVQKGQREKITLDSGPQQRQKRKRSCTHKSRSFHNT